MSEQPPYVAPPGQRWEKSWFGLGPWTLVDDPAYPAPPIGYRYQPNFLTGKPELIRTHSNEITAVEGLSSAGSDRNSVKTPNHGPPSREYSFKTPDPSKITPGHEFTGPRSADASPDPALRQIGKTRYNSGTDEAAIF